MCGHFTFLVFEEYAQKILRHYILNTSNLNKTGAHLLLYVFETLLQVS